MLYTPAAAAQKAGVSRSVISRALKDGSLHGTRKNNGHWSIAKSDLEEWMRQITTRAAKPKNPQAKAAAPTRHPADVAHIARLEAAITDLRKEVASAKQGSQKTREELAAVSATLDAARSSMSDLRADRDSWRDQSNKLAASHAERRPGVIARIFGRS